MNSGKPSVLLLGGVGVVGRCLVSYLLQLDSVSYVRVADKVLPVMAFMEENMMNNFDNAIVEFVQADLTKDSHLDRVFALHENGKNFDIVINLAAETRYGQPESLYKSRCTDLSRLCAERAANIPGVRYIEVSTAFVYKSQARTASTETSTCQPWTSQATAKLNAEMEVKRVAEEHSMDYVILRPAIIYGIGDVNGLMPRVVCAATYVELNETMRFLWDAYVKLNTVHIMDVVRAIWHVAYVDRGSVPSGCVLNLADSGDTDAGKVNAILAEVFGIKVGYLGTIISNVARLRLTDFVEAANEKHMAPWEKLCRAHQIERSPLFPYMSAELLDCNHVFVDGRKIESISSFRYEHRSLSKAELLASIDHAVRLKIFPPVMSSVSRK